MDSTLSIIPSDGATNEFPVLKAFQEYIDAEQAKARKRMLGLSVFFIILLLVVVITFVLVLTTVVNRNQALSDRLLDYALKERERMQTVQPPQPPPAPAPQISAQEVLKPFIERLEREQAEMKAAYEKQQKEAEAKAAAQEVARNEEMRKVRAELEKERARTKKENDRQEAIERHRRRLYPDYYRLPETAPSMTPSTQLSSPATQKPPSQPIPKAAPQKKSTPPLSTIKPVTYFNLDDEESVPFLLETPKPSLK